MTTPPVPPVYPLSRWNYLYWPSNGGPYDASSDPASAGYEPQQVFALPGYALPGDSTNAAELVEQELYQRPSDRLHGMGLHGAGVAYGLQIQWTTTGADFITIAPGLALDAAGRHIYLAAGGFALIGTPPPGPPFVVGQSTSSYRNLTTVPPTGIALPTTGCTAGDTYLVVVQWWETIYKDNSYYVHSPWLQLVLQKDYQPGIQVILGQVVLAPNSLNVSSATYGDPGLQRTSISIPAQTVQLTRAQSGSTTIAGVTTQVVDTANWGQVRARDSDGTGGIEIAVENSTDEVHVMCDAGGNFSTFGIDADTVQVGGQAGGTLQVNVIEASNGSGAVSFPNGINIPNSMSASATGVSIATGASIAGALDVGGLVIADLLGVPTITLGDGVTISTTILDDKESGLTVGHRMMVKQGDNSAGIWFFQTAPNSRQAFVGMKDDTNVGLYGSTGASWGLTMDTGSGVVSIPHELSVPTITSGSSNGVSIPAATDATQSALTVGQRMTVQGDSTNTAGIWLDEGNVQKGFVGLYTEAAGIEPTGIGLYSSGAPQWGLHMDLSTGVVSMPNGIANSVTVEEGITAQNLIGNNTQPAPVNFGNAYQVVAVSAQSQNGFALVATSTIGAILANGNSQFNGNVTVKGTLAVSGKNCLVDHPSDPENKTLTHACVESDERFNVYSGNIALDDNGEARVTLPRWVAAFNTDFRYQLTCIGQSAPVYVAQEVRDDAFSIAGGTAGMKVSWQLTGVRNDAWAKANPLVVEQDKPEDEKGFFLNPDVFGHDHTRGVQYKRHGHLTEAFPRQAEHAAAADVAGRTSG